MVDAVAARAARRQPAWKRMTAMQLRDRVCGVADFNVDLWRRHTAVSGGPQDHHIVGWFWSCLEEMNADQLRVLFRSATGSERLPAGGFARLIPAFKLNIGDFNQIHYHACFNTIDLPIGFDSREALKLGLEITVGDGFNIV